MAARLQVAPEGSHRIVNLRCLGARDLDPLLQEEIVEWRNDFEWDFGRSAELVQRFVGLRALNGAALVESGEVAGYVYWVVEDAKGLIGDLYVRPRFRTAARENALLHHAVTDMIAATPVTRVESQVMMLRFEPGRPLPEPDRSSAYIRNFMKLETARADLGEGSLRKLCYIEKWSGLYQEAAAKLIAAAYAGHIDSRINDQYRSPSGARKFLHNIVQYPGCGTFFGPASYAGFDAATGGLGGVCLASIVGPDSGHITQICVQPAFQGTGLGHELLRRSLATFREMGYRSVSLTVTAANSTAVKLYERVGFGVLRRFSAYVWDGLPGHRPLP